MPTRKRRVKREISLDKVTQCCGRSKSTESPASGMAKDTENVTLVLSPSGDQQRSVVHTARKRAELSAREEKSKSVMFVPVVDQNQKPLMPTTSARARKWIKSGKATPFWKRGVFCVRLNVEPSDRKTQEVAVGIDPGSKREAFTVKSSAHAYLNVLTEAVGWVKDAVETRRNARRTRRNRNTPYRQNRKNRSRGSLPPSTKARWQWKLRVSRWLVKMFPIRIFVVEDIKARTTGKRKWDASFSPLEVGKNWFYEELAKLGMLSKKSGWETKLMRDELGLKKNGSKMADKFECHNVDSWVLARSAVGGAGIPENTGLIKLIPLRFHRRQLHVFRPAAGGVRKKYGSTRSLGFTRGSLVIHSKHGFCFVGGTRGGRISLHSAATGEVLTRKARTEDVKFLSYASWRKEEGVSSAV